MTQALRARILAAIDDAQQVASDLIEAGAGDDYTSAHLDELTALYAAVEAL